MLPVLYRFTFETDLARTMLYLFCGVMVAYGAFNGWRTAGGIDAKGNPIEPSQEQRRNQAIFYAVAGVVLSLVLIAFALKDPPGFVPRFIVGLVGKSGGTGVPLHTYGIMIGLGFLTAATVASMLCLREWPGEQGVERRDSFYDLVFYLFLGGVLGSHDLFVLVNWKEFAGTPAKAPETWSAILDIVAALAISAGVVRAAFFKSAEAHRQFVDKAFRNFVIVAVGSRLLFLVTTPGFADRMGGLVFYGGLIGATVAAIWYCAQNNIEFMRLADLCIPTVSLGQAFGRLGCYSAGCCWGRITTHDKAPFAVEFPGKGAQNLFGQVGGTPSLAWSSQSDALTETRWVLESTGEVFPQQVDGAVRISAWAQEHGHTLPIHPTQLYESAGQILLFALLLSARRFRRFHGQIFAMWLMCYAILRSSVELFRGDLERGTLHGLIESIPTTAWYNVSTSQLVSLAMFSLGSWLLVRNFRMIKAQPAVDLGALTAA